MLDFKWKLHKFEYYVNCVSNSKYYVNVFVTEEIPPALPPRANRPPSTMNASAADQDGGDDRTLVVRKVGDQITIFDSIFQVQICPIRSSLQSLQCISAETV